MFKRTLCIVSATAAFAAAAAPAADATYGTGHAVTYGTGHAATYGTGKARHARVRAQRFAVRLLAR